MKPKKPKKTKETKHKNTGYRIKMTKKIHSGWKEWENLPADIKSKLLELHPRGYFGKYHYIFTSKRGEISLIQLTDYFYKDKDIWEIYSGNTLFGDTMRFDTKEEAINYIKKLLTR